MMAALRISALLAGISCLAFPALAQEETPPADMPEAAAMPIDDAQAAEGEEVGETVEVNPDEMADMLNSNQQLKQTFTLKRTINGEVVETDKRTVTFSRDMPYRETEAGQTTLERLKASFDGEALTRTEAFEEAKLDFLVADVDRDEAMTGQEFAALVDSWRKNDARKADAPTEEIARQRQYDAFLEELDPSVAQQQTEAYALEKFAFMAGAAETMSLQDYVREYLLDFDSMDTDKDTVLTGNELMRFRALNRGETLDM
ncbi:hypothetical protein [Hyphococcus sp.]|uniref:hypothetical protein n=1 Tax=Hyphococcus sp. TaxID=2038636 RepID=UPI0035C6E6DD